MKLTMTTLLLAALAVPAFAQAPKAAREHNPPTYGVKPHVVQCGGAEDSL